MKKNFLLLFLMALLPLAGWAVSADLLTKPSLATGLIYTGSELNLTTGSYSLPANYDLAEGGVRWIVTDSEAAPTEEGGELNAVATDAGTYYVWYKVLKDNSAYDTDGEWTLLNPSVKYVRISKATPTVTAPEGFTSLVYTGEGQQLIQTAAAITAGAPASVVDYSIDNTNWYSDIADANLKKTDAGSYNVYYKVDASADGNWVASNGTIVVSIGKATPVITAPVGKTGLVYNKAARQLIETAATVTKGEGTVKYSLDNTNWYDAINASELKRSTANEEGYTVYYKLPESTNFFESEVGEIKVPIERLDINIGANIAFTNMPEATYVYDGSEKTTTTGIKNGSSDLTEGNSFTRTYEGDRTNVTAEGFTTVLTGINNYKGTKSWNSKITPLDISSSVTVDGSLSAAQPYTGAKIEPSTEGKLTNSGNTLVEGTDYNVTYGTTGDGAKDNKTVASGGAIVIDFIGNYSGTKTVNFNISKAQLTVTAGNNTKNYGDVDPTPEYIITGWNNDVEEEVTGTATFTRTSGEDAGEYTWAYTSGLTAANYDFVSDDPANQGKLTITSNGVTITVKAAEKGYGYVLPALDKNAFEYEAAGLGTLASIASMEFVVTDAESNVYAAGDRLAVGTYTITAQNAVASPTTAATFTYNAGTLTITPASVVITTKPQDVDYTTDPWTITDNDFTDTYVEIGDGTTKYDYTTFNAAFGTTFANDAVFKAYFINALTWDAESATLAVPGNIGVELTGTYNSTNFNVTFDKASVNFTGASTAIDIVRLDVNEYAAGETPVADALKEYDGVPGTTVTIKAKAVSTIDAFRKMKANQWYAMVLPFNTTVRQISQAFGYAVVDIFDETSVLTDDVKFKLHVGEIEANKPFIVKTDVDRDLQANPLTFTLTAEQPIVYSENPVAATADESAKFIGQYDGKKGFDDAEEHQYVISLGDGNISNTKSTTYIPPMSAYIWMENQMNGMSKARMINIEEPDGTVTSISTVNADGTVSAEGWYNLNGVKQQGTPAQKGVYIQNGKKVIIK